MVSSALATECTQILVLHSPHGEDSIPGIMFENDSRVVSVATFEEAVQALRNHRFDVIVSQTGDFLALERAAVNQQAAFILETIGQGVCVLDLEGRVIWHNQHFSQCPPDLIRFISNRVQECFKDGDASKHPQGLRLNVPCSDYKSYEVYVNPIVTGEGKLNRVAAVIEDASEAQRLRERIDAIDAAGRELVSFERDPHLTVPTRLEMLENRVLRFVQDILRYDKFCIRTLNKEDNELAMLCSMGLCEAGKNLKLYAQPENNGISGYVAATGRSYICNDVSKDPRYLVGIQNARSSLTVPLKLHDKVIGIFNVESDRTGAFDESDRQFAEIFGRYIAMSLDILELMVFERHAIGGHLAEDVTKQLAGPINDIQTEAQTLMDDYIGNDELRRRLGNILQHVNEIRTSVKHVGEPELALVAGASRISGTDPLFDGKHILVADDNDMLRETIADVLTKFGCQVSVAANGNETADLIAADKFDLVLSDIKMPGKNGYEIFSLARQINPEVPVVLMTGFGYDPHHSLVKASEKKLNGTLFKPFKTDELLEQIRQALQPAATK